MTVSTIEDTVVMSLVFFPELMRPISHNGNVSQKSWNVFAKIFINQYAINEISGIHGEADSRYNWSSARKRL